MTQKKRSTSTRNHLDAHIHNPIPAKSELEVKRQPSLFLWDWRRRWNVLAQAFAQIQSHVMMEGFNCQVQSDRPPEHIRSLSKTSWSIYIISAGQHVPQTQAWLKSNVAQQLVGKEEAHDGSSPFGPSLLSCPEAHRQWRLLLSLINLSESRWMCRNKNSPAWVGGGGSGGDWKAKSLDSF